MKFALATAALAMGAAEAAIANSPADYAFLIEKADEALLNETMGSLVVGGTEALPMYKYGFATGMRSTAAGSSFCGGSLIAPDVVLTAAHCLSVPWVSTGTHYRSGTSDGQQRSVARTVRHPNYNTRTLDYDFALLFLSSSSTSQTIALASNTGGDEAVGRTATVIGWGATSENGATSSVLREVDVGIVTNAACEQALGGITSRMICAGGISGYDSCQGDSGGPFFVSKNSNPILVGDVSWGIGCARAGLPGVYGRISSVRSWIDDNVRAYSTNDVEVQWERI
jgi:secreted trypsin-like serine protease